MLRPIQSAIFTDTDYLTPSQIQQKILKIAKYFQWQGINETSLCLIRLHDPLDQILALFALLLLKSKVALINPRLPELLTKELLKDLGPYVSVDHFEEALEPYDNITFDTQLPLILIASSGSQGTPKWIVSKIDNWLKSAEGTILHLNAKPHEPWILNLPLFHVSGLAIVFRAFFISAPLVITKHDLFLPNSRISLVSKQIETLEKSGQLERLLKSESILIGGGKLDTHTFKKVKHLPIYISYGMTEACSSISLSEKSPNEIQEGKVLKYRTLELSETNQIFIGGEAACDYIWKKGSLVFLKNHKGLIATSDHGMICSSMIHIQGRLDERIEINGEKIFPFQIENELKAHFSFSSLIVTHIIDENLKTHIVAFCHPIPDDKTLNVMKHSIGSLFFPKYFLPLEESSGSEKIRLIDLKEKAFMALRNVQ